MTLSSDEDGKIRRVVALWEDAWNRHDLPALARLFTGDADFVNVFGVHWKGRAEIQRMHEERHLTRFRNSIWTTNDIKIGDIGDGVAVAHVTWSREGDLDFEGQPKPLMRGILTWTLVTRSEGWLIRAAQNTNVVNVPT